MSTNRELFLKNWEKFEARVRGRLIQQSDKQALSHPYAKLVLSDAAGDWSSSYDEGGRWLNAYTKEHPDRGAAIARILTQEMTFTEPDPPLEIPEVLNYAIPVAGAAAGLGIATALGAGTVVKTVSTLAPAALLYPATKTVGNNVNEKNRIGLVDAYMAQLQQYRDAVLDLLEIKTQ